MISHCYSPLKGRLPTRYSPVRHSVIKDPSKLHLNNLVRLACVRHAASVHPEPGSNSLVKSLSPSQVFQLTKISVFTLRFEISKHYFEFQGLCIYSIIISWYSLTFDLNGGYKLITSYFYRVNIVYDTTNAT